MLCIRWGMFQLKHFILSFMAEKGLGNYKTCVCDWLSRRKVRMLRLWMEVAKAKHVLQRVHDSYVPDCLSNTKLKPSFLSINHP